MILILLSSLWLLSTWIRTNSFFTVAAFLSFPYYYFLHSIPLLWLPYDRGAYSIMQAHEALMLLSVFGTAWLLSTKLPVFNTFRYQKYFNFYSLFSVVLVLLLVLITVSGTVQWVTNPRIAYQHHRSGIGFFYASYVFALGVLLLRLVYENKFGIGRVFTVIVLAYFSGSKGIILSSFVSMSLVYANTRDIRNLELILFNIFGLLILFVFIFIMIVAGFFGENSTSIFQHFDAIFNSVKFYERYNISFDGFETDEKVFLNSRLLGFFQNFSNDAFKSFHFTHFPDQAALGHFRAHLSSTYYIASGYSVILLPFIAVFLNLGMFIKIMFVEFCCRFWPILDRRVQNFAITFLVFQPLIKFFVDLQFLLFITAGFVYVLGFKKTRI